MKNVILRMATEADASDLLAIYAPYVKTTSISFEEAVPSLEEFASRVRDILMGYPYIVCIIEGKIIGYAYAHSYRSRAAYRWDAELSVYTAQDYHGGGVGTALYSALIELLKLQHFQVVYGIVTSPNPKSERLHERLGFTNTGVMTKSGYKLGVWHDIINYEKLIGSHSDYPEEVLMINQLDSREVSDIFNRYAADIRK